ncbi:SatD family protein [Janibacter cremeus]|uniref:SatD family protein n=1 Tax=Janibacter cremeus TaxID=1285192 RepID=UPI0023F88720|nr:SatD family protein [Janibacter cremeus]WEV79459.1 SatD family protein [Janibacter cremeus]
MTVVVTLIGDVVSSRSAPDRQELHALLQETLTAVTAATDPIHPLRITVGDEFQGAWERRGQALHAAFLLRLSLLPRVETRYGLGRGEVTTLEQDGTVQDGPGWWSAREAITAAKGAEADVRSDGLVVRTRWQEDGPTGPALDAAVRHRDLLVAGLDDRSLRLLRGLLQHRTQRALAEEEGISPTAVSRRVHRDGLEQLVAIDADLSVLP